MTEYVSKLWREKGRESKFFKFSIPYLRIEMLNIFIRSIHLWYRWDWEMVTSEEKTYLLLETQKLSFFEAKWKSFLKWKMYWKVYSPQKWSSHLKGNHNLLANDSQRAVDSHTVNIQMIWKSFFKSIFCQMFCISEEIEEYMNKIIKNENLFRCFLIYCVCF